MKYGKIIVEENERALLQNIIGMDQSYRDQIYQASLEKLKREFVLADILNDNEMPEDVVRFNSVVTIETPWNVKRSYQIVVPEKSDIRNNKISVLAPMSLSLFGYAEGDAIEWQFPTGTDSIKIVKVVQRRSRLDFSKYETGISEVF